MLFVGQGNISNLGVAFENPGKKKSISEQALEEVDKIWEDGTNYNAKDRKSTKIV